MALKVIEFFGFKPLDKAAAKFVAERWCPFVGSKCIKPAHGACSVQQVTDPEPIICCPNRLYADDFRVLNDVATEAFGKGTELVRPSMLVDRRFNGGLTGNEVAVFGRYWGQELPLPRPPGVGNKETRKYYVDWILARFTRDGTLFDMTAIEVQTIDTTGNYSDQVERFLSGKQYRGGSSRSPEFSNAGMNWENVNKRILPQIIYKGHVLRREAKCTKGLFFVCPRQVYDKIRDRLGGHLHDYPLGNGTITFRSYELGTEVKSGQHRGIEFSGQFTTTVDQVALAFTAPMNLPDGNVYEAAIKHALK